jgi:hypothetical protein
MQYPLRFLRFPSSQILGIHIALCQPLSDLQRRRHDSGEDPALAILVTDSEFHPHVRRIIFEFFIPEKYRAAL